MYILLETRNLNNFKNTFDDLDCMYFFVVVVGRFHEIKYSSLLSIVSARAKSTGS